MKERREKIDEFKVGDMVRVINPKRKVDVFLGSNAQEMVGPYQLGKTSIHDPEFKKWINVKTGPLSIDDLLFEKREPFKVVEIELASDESTLSLLWDYIRGCIRTHPQSLKIRNDNVVYGKKETEEFLSASIFEKIKPQ